MSLSTDATAPIAVPAPSRRFPAIGWRRLAKLAAAVAILGVGLSALLANQGYVVTDNAVVSGYRLALRTPIAGRLIALSAPVGARVRAGEVLGRVRSRRLDDQHLLDLRQSLTRVSAQAAAEAQEQTRLRGLRAGLLRRAATGLTATSDQLGGLLVQAAATLDVLMAQRDLARVGLNRTALLWHDGVASAAAHDTARAGLAAAQGQVAAQRGQLAALVAQAAAASRGVLLDSGGNDVPYSRQRADEIAIRLAALGSAITEADADRAAIEARLAAERRRLDRLGTAALRAPAAGMVWKRNAVAGEHLAPGETVVELVDCAAPVVLAAIPKIQASHVAIGSRVRLRLAGETTDRAGTVLALGGERFRDHGRALAAVPAARRTPRLIVRIGLDRAPTGGTCLIGRTLRAMIPIAHGSWLARVL